jgi:2Fe-2S ferredoxin
MTIQLHVTDREGREHIVEAAPQGSLMDVLRELEYGVTAICGGMCSCATCHVYIATEWMARVAPQDSYEHDLVIALEYHRDNSRLSCQIKLSEDLDDLRVTLAPEE